MQPKILSKEIKAMWKMIFAVLVALASLGAHAEPSACEAGYRQAYLDYSSSYFSSQRTSEAHEIYKVYFDYTNHLIDAYAEAEPIFRWLALDKKKEPSLLAELARQIQNGELCLADGRTPKTFREIGQALRVQFSQK